MGRIKRSALHLLLGTLVVLATVFGGGVACAARVVSAYETGTDVEVESEALTAAAARGKAHRRATGADEASVTARTLLAALGASRVLHRADGRTAPPTRFLPASPGLLLLLCHFRC